MGHDAGVTGVTLTRTPLQWRVTLLLIAVAFVLGSGYLAAGLVLDGHGAAVDQTILARLDPTRTSTDVAVVISAFGGRVVSVVLGALLVGLLWWRTRRLDLPLLALVTLAGGVALTVVLKPLVDRSRPQDALTASGSAAFPSGHATRAMLICLLLAWLLVATGRIWLRWLGAVALLAVAVVIGASRVVLQVHWATDVLAGWGLAAMWFAAVVVILRPVRPPGLEILTR